LLGSINLSEYVKNPFTKDAYFDFATLKKDVFYYVKGLNECLQENIEFMPLKEQEEAVRKYRAIGLGYFGSGDMFIKMGLRYGSKESIDLVDMIGYEVAKEAVISSSKLVNEFPMPDIIKDNAEKIFSSKFYKAHFNEGEKYLPINTSLLTSAPTGTLSTMFNVSGGIEPIFSLKMWRKTESLNNGKETSYEIDIPVIEGWKMANNTTVLPEWIERSTALTLNIEERINIQSAWQKHIDNAISSTVNLAEETSVEDVMNLYMSAWKQGLKGITVFRTGCKRGAILTTKKKESTITEEDVFEEALAWGDTLDTSDDLIGLKRKIMSGCGSLHILAYFDYEGRLMEIFLDKGSTGGCFSYSNGLSRMISIAARSGVAFDKIIDQLNSTLPCPSYVGRTIAKGDTSRGKNCPNAIANALIEMKQEVNTILMLDEGGVKEEIKNVKNKDDLPLLTEDEILDANMCPICYKQGHEEKLNANSGCFSCLKCGYSKCG